MDPKYSVSPWTVDAIASPSHCHPQQDDAVPIHLGPYPDAAIQPKLGKQHAHATSTIHAFQLPSG